MKRGLFTFLAIMLFSAAAVAEETHYLPSLDGIYWQSDEAPAPGFDEPPQKPLIAVIIDDVGVDRKKSARAVRNLPPEVTMSYLAYGPHIAAQVAEAKEKGHEIMLHLPWEPDAKGENPGPHPLTVKMSKEKLQKNLLANLDAFTGYTGVNNHMGSRFSRYRPGLEQVMAELKKRGVYFVDSKTTPDSIAEKVAQEHGIPVTHRDVFLDHDETVQLVSSALKQTERHALKYGTALLIAHPKDLSLASLESWLPSLKAKGFQLVTMSELLEARRKLKLASSSGIKK